ncbi:MAG: GNAT family N-acetyltransferase [Gemmatimonadaceae bacterium]
MLVPKWEIPVDELPLEEDARAIVEGLRRLNVAVIGDPQEVPLGIFLRNKSGVVRGGLLGRARWQWLYVATLWLPEPARGARYGTRLMHAAEAWAGLHRCVGVFLDTFEYQALLFYQKLGYELFGTLEGYPPGYRQFYLSKRLSAAS